MEQDGLNNDECNLSSGLQTVFMQDKCPRPIHRTRRIVGVTVTALPR